MSPRSIVLIGAGQASAVAARTLRRRGYDGQIILVGDENERPYQRPPLSKEYLSEGDESGLYLLPESWTDAHSVEVRTGVRALKINAADGDVLLDDGTTLMADRIMIATGGHSRRMPEAHGDRVLYLRTKSDADALRAQVGPGCRVVVIGAGFIGAEVASTVRSLGADVTVLEAGPVPLARALGERLGASCARLHASAGVDLRVNVAVDQVCQEGDEVVVTSSAGTFRADYALVGIGMEPNDEVARDSGIEVANGILVDEYCRTSLENVYAAGDVANHYHPLFRTTLRVEHFDNASRQGAAAADNMLGRATVFDDPHWFWSDQYGANLQYVGHANGGDELVTRGDVCGDSWSAFFLRGGVVRGGFAMNCPEDVMVARELITLEAAVPPAVLHDVHSDLAEALEQL
jgi:3-phenylpropionate/trans-cinnamate dioxygenase ferredoxin reductase subunit